jgi:CRP/FNR family cyclic AMP-dependent transcriptional regulator
MSSVASFEKLVQHADNVKAYKEGQIIFQAGDPGDCMYVIRSGEVDIHIHDKVVETVGAGGIFGEMALLDKEARSATAVARGDCEVVPIDQKRFLFMVQQTPFFALELMKVLTHRLRTMNQLF